MAFTKSPSVSNNPLRFLPTIWFLQTRKRMDTLWYLLLFHELCKLWWFWATVETLLGGNPKTGWGEDRIVAHCGKCKELWGFPNEEAEKSKVDADNLNACKVFTILVATTLAKPMVNRIEAVAVAKLDIPGFELNVNYKCSWTRSRARLLAEINQKFT